MPLGHQLATATGGPAVPMGSPCCPRTALQAEEDSTDGAVVLPWGVSQGCSPQPKAALVAVEKGLAQCLHVHLPRPREPPGGGWSRRPAPSSAVCRSCAPASWPVDFFSRACAPLRQSPPAWGWRVTPSPRTRGGVRVGDHPVAQENSAQRGSRPRPDPGQQPCGRGPVRPQAPSLSTAAVRWPPSAGPQACLTRAAWAAWVAFPGQGSLSQQRQASLSTAALRAPSSPRVTGVGCHRLPCLLRARWSRPHLSFHVCGQRLCGATNTSRSVPPPSLEAHFSPALGGPVGGPR